MSKKRRRHEERFGKVTTRPEVRGRTKAETRAKVLELADHKCAWCGKPATLIAPRALGASVKGSVCWNAAWCGMCDPDMLKVGMGPPSRFAKPDPGKLLPGGRYYKEK